MLRIRKKHTVAVAIATSATQKAMSQLWFLAIVLNGSPATKAPTVDKANVKYICGINYTWQVFRLRVFHPWLNGPEGFNPQCPITTAEHPWATSLAPTCSSWMTFISMPGTVTYLWVKAPRKYGWNRKGLPLAIRATTAWDVPQKLDGALSLAITPMRAIGP